MNIRKLQESDIPFAAHIVAQNYSEKDGELSYREMEAMYKNHTMNPFYYVVEHKKEIIGIGGYSQSWMDYDTYEIFWINIALLYQRQGIGSMLVQHIIKKIKEDPDATSILLKTHSPEFYSKNFGFQIIRNINDSSKLMILSL